MDFPLILGWLVLLTGIFWCLDRWYFAPKRRAESARVLREFDQANEEALRRMEPQVVDARKVIEYQKTRQPWWLEYTAGLFPVILVVFLLRSFLFEPFRIPSGSMLPTLHIGDFILVNKFDYGLRLPIIGTKVVPIGSPERGDVVVFHYPQDPSIDYIKRIVGLPGDTVEYRNKVLYINGVEQKQSDPRAWVDPSNMLNETILNEQLGTVNHEISINERAPSWVPQEAILKKEPTCQYNNEGFICKVPQGMYFAMGDNRDNSEDSRYWGFVPDELLVGKAVFIWANFSDMSRIGTFR